MFYGEYIHSLDKKGRIILPSRFREVARSNYVEKFYITRGLDKCLFMFSEDEWKTQEVKFKSLPFTKSEARKFNRLYFSGTVEIVPDKQGRVFGYDDMYALDGSVVSANLGVNPSLTITALSEYIMSQVPAA